MNSGWDIYRLLLTTEESEKCKEGKKLLKPMESTFILPYEGKTLRLI